MYKLDKKYTVEKKIVKGTVATDDYPKNTIAGERKPVRKR